MEDQTLTAVICTRDRPDVLRRALKSLDAQDRAPDERLVVDNAPVEGGVEAMVHEEFPGTRYILEPRRGLDFARNRALQECQCDLVAFLDDDAAAAPDWTSQIVAIFREQPRVAALTGRTRPMEIETPAQVILEANGGMGCRKAQAWVLPRDSRRLPGGVRAPDFLGAMSSGAGCNMALRRGPALEIGGFDEALDVGTKVPGGGENDLFWRLLKRGLKVGYDPRMVVYHEHRAELAGIVEQLSGYQLGVAAWLTKVIRRSAGFERWGAVAFLAWRLVKPGVRLVKRGFGRDPLPAGALVSMWASSWRGLYAYPSSVRMAREIREQTS